MFNANNYGYNPYGRYIPQQPMIQQPVEMQTPTNNYQQIQTRPSLNGKIVESEDVVKAIEIPLDGSVSYFPLVDGNTIITKQLQNDGTTKITVFKPVTNVKEEIKYITEEDMKKALDNIDLSELDDIKDDIKELRQDIKDLKKSKKTGD